MNGYMTFGGLLLVFVAVGAIWRIRRARSGSVLVQLLGGANVFAAALLAWMTAVTIFAAANYQLGLSASFLKWSSIGFAVATALLWIVRGLVPQSVATGKVGRMILGHLLVLIGTVVHGSVTFYMPVLIGLGWLDREAMAVMPWLAIVTLPAACLLWVIALILIVDSGSTEHLQAPRETHA